MVLKISFFCVFFFKFQAHFFLSFNRKDSILIKNKSLPLSPVGIADHVVFSLCLENSHMIG